MNPLDSLDTLSGNVPRSAPKSYGVPAGTKIWPVKKQVGTQKIWATSHNYLEVDLCIEYVVPIPITNEKFSRFISQNADDGVGSQTPRYGTVKHNYQIGMFDAPIVDSTDPVGVVVIGFVFDLAGKNITIIELSIFQKGDLPR